MPVKAYYSDGLLGLGFRLTPEQLERMHISPDHLPPVLKPYVIGRDLVQNHEVKFVIDFYGISEVEAQALYPGLYQHLLVFVKPERDHNRRETRRVNWWLFGENAPTLRRGLAGLHRFIATCRTAKHRAFTFLPANHVPDAKVIGISLDDAYWLGCLSSHLHLVWALRTGAFLEDRPNYNHSDCFGKFPFPACSEEQKQRIRELGEALDAHRKRQQAAHPGLTITDMYNVLEKLRSGEALSAKDKKVHEQGLISVLKQIHDDLDAAVFDAYGWPADLTDEQILEKLVALNAERAEEERNGLIRWLRPEFQNPQGQAQVQATLDLGEPEDEETPAPKGKKKDAATRRRGDPAKGKADGQRAPWPSSLADQAKALRAALTEAASPVTPEDLARRFVRAPRDRVAELLDTLVSLGQAREVNGDKYST